MMGMWAPGIEALCVAPSYRLNPSYFSFLRVKYPLSPISSLISSRLGDQGHAILVPYLQRYDLTAINSTTLCSGQPGPMAIPCLVLADRVDRKPPSGEVAPGSSWRCVEGILLQNHPQTRIRLVCHSLACQGEVTSLTNQSESDCNNLTFPCAQN